MQFPFHIFELGPQPRFLERMVITYLTNVLRSLLPETMAFMSNPWSILHPTQQVDFKPITCLVYLFNSIMIT